MLSEYGIGKAFSAAGEAYLLEHGETIIKKYSITTTGSALREMKNGIATCYAVFFLRNI